MTKLKRIVRINNKNLYPYAEIFMNGNVYFQGLNGNGKTSMERICLFLYVANSKGKWLDLPREQSFLYYLEYPNYSYIIYELEDAMGSFFIAVSKDNGNKLVFHFVDLPYQKDYFYDETDTFRGDWNSISGRIGEESCRYDKITSVDKFCAILYQDINSWKDARLYKRFALAKASSNYGFRKILSNIFAGKGSINTKIYKDILIDSLGKNNPINITRELTLVRDINEMMSDYKIMHKKDADGNEIMSIFIQNSQNALNRMDSYDKDIKSNIDKINFLRASLPDELKSLNERRDLISKDRQTKKENWNKRKTDIQDKLNVCKVQLKVAQDGYEDIEKGITKYSRPEYIKLFELYRHHDEISASYNATCNELVLQSKNYNSLEEKYDKILKERISPFDKALDKMNQEKITIKGNFLQDKLSLNENYDKLSADLEDKKSKRKAEVAKEEEKLLSREDVVLFAEELKKKNNNEKSCLNEFANSMYEKGVINGKISSIREFVPNILDSLKASISTLISKIPLFDNLEKKFAEKIKSLKKEESKKEKETNEKKEAYQTAKKEAGDLALRMTDAILAQKRLDAKKETIDKEYNESLCKIKKDRNTRLQQLQRNYDNALNINKQNTADLEKKEQETIKKTEDEKFEEMKGSNVDKQKILNLENEKKELKSKLDVIDKEENKRDWYRYLDLEDKKKTMPSLRTKIEQLESTSSSLEKTLNEEKAEYNETEKKINDELNVLFEKGKMLEKDMTAISEFDSNTLIPDGCKSILTAQTTESAKDIIEHIEKMLYARDSAFGILKRNVVKIYKDFRYDNIYSIMPVNLTNDRDKDMEQFCSYARNIIKAYNEGIYEQCDMTARHRYADIFNEAANVVRGIQDSQREVKRYVAKLNKDWTVDKLSVYRKLDYMQLEVRDSGNPIWIVLKNMNDFYTDNVAFFTWLTNTSENQPMLEDFSEEQSSMLLKEAEDMISKFQDAIEESNGDEGIRVNDTMELMLTGSENGNKIEQKENVSQFGSNGIGKLTQVLIYLSLIKVFKEKLNTTEDFQVHIFIDEVEQIDSINLRNLIKTANEEGVWLVSSAVKCGVASNYDYIYNFNDIDVEGNNTVAILPFFHKKPHAIDLGYVKPETETEEKE